MRFCCLLLFFFSLTPSAPGQDALPADSDSVHALPEIEVSAFRYDADPSLQAVRVSHVDRAALEAASARDAGEALARIGSLFIRRYGSGLSLPSLRGGQAAQTLLLIDGMPLFDPQLGQVDLSLIPASLLDGVSVMHGAGGSLYGSSSMTGVINFQTLRVLQAPFGASASLGAGPFGERQAGLSMGGRHKRLSVSMALSHYSEEGDFPYLNPSLLPPRRDRRDGADRRQTALFGKATIDHREARTIATGWLNWSIRGLPGLATAAQQGERQWDDLARGWIQHMRRLGAGTFTARLAYQRSSLRYVHPRLDLDQTGRAASFSLATEWDRSLNERWNLKAGVDGGFRKARHPSLETRAEELQLGLFLKGQHVRPRLRIYPAAWLDGIQTANRSQEIALSPSLGLNLQPFEIPFFHFKVQVGRSFRAPTFNDRFWQPGGNPDLHPEIGWIYETGLRFEISDSGARLAIETTVYRQRLREQITWLPKDAGYWAPVNLSRTETLGIESTANLDVKLSPRLSANAGLFHAFTDARDRSDPMTSSFDKPLRYVPRHQAKSSAGMGYRRADWNLFVDVFARYTGRRYITTDATQWLDPYFTIDAHTRASLDFPRTTLSVSLMLENVANQTFEVIKGYPMPPRRLRVQLSFRWHGSTR